ncbi:MAG: S-layer homology domain-containing protein [Dysosmobacter sp.]|nr:S-layer homology domain-containing protein [Dysosmobacter sp.]MDY3867233.1 S-layer homology domain-containing protein [Dysosmobacter sp.]
MLSLHHDRHQWYAKAVEWAVENGVTNGTSASTFSPNAGCTRVQIVTFLFRAYNK